MFENPGNVSIGVVTDECEKENNIVREGITLELAKANNPTRDVKDASIQTDIEECASSTNLFERRFMEIELECEQRLRREMNAKLRLSAKQQAMQAMARLERKHKEECRLLHKQIVEEDSRSKHREKELLQVISQQHLARQKELKQVEQKLERERLEKATLESEMGLLIDRMKQLQMIRLSENEKSECALTASVNSLEQQKRQFQINLAEAIRERDQFQLMLARESEKLLANRKDSERTRTKLVDMERKLVKTESALDAKNSEAAALRALLKQCQSTVKSLSYNSESGHDYISQTFEQTAATMAPTIQTTHISKSIAQERHALVTSLTAQPLPSSIAKESLLEPAKTRPSPEDPPCFSLKDPPEVTQPLVQSGEELDGKSVRTIFPKVLRDGSSIEESPLQIEMQLDAADKSQTHPAVTELDKNEQCRTTSGHTPEADKQNEVFSKMSPEQYPSSNVQDKSSKTTPRDERTSAVCVDESSELKNGISTDSDDTSDTDEYSMGSFCTVEDHKLDKFGRLSFFHIK